MSADNELLDAEILLQEEGTSIIHYRSSDEQEREDEIEEEVLNQEEVEKASNEFSKLGEFVLGRVLGQDVSSLEKDEEKGYLPQENLKQLRDFFTLFISDNRDAIGNSIKDSEISQLHQKYSRLMEFVTDYRNNNESRANGLRDKTGQDKRPLRLRKVSPEVVQQSKKEIIQNALSIVCEQLNAQSAAIFLFSKNGSLDRAGLHGVDKNVLPLEDEWFEDESYALGESFTGKAAQPKDGSKYGQIQYTRSLGEESLKGAHSYIYSQRLGPLKCAIAIPLNGRNKTYGVLRVVNKVAKDPKTNRLSLIDSEFSQDDVNLLLLLAVYTGNVLSNFRRDIQTEIFKYLSHLLIQPYPKQDALLQELYQEVVDLLVQNPETAFKACILRSKNDASKTLDVEVTSLATTVTDDRDDKPRSVVEDELLLLVVTEQRPLILQGEHVQESIDKFKNKQWIKDNDLQAFGCFPCVVKEGDLLGTLSLYAGYNYEFHADSIDFLQGIADMVASFMMRGRSEKNLVHLQRSFNEGFTASFELLSTLSIEEEFKKLAEQWYEETMTNPFITEKLMHPAYLQIIGLGPKVVPFILKELQRNPNHWFVALKAITRENPVAPDGDIVKSGV